MVMDISAAPTWHLGAVGAHCASLVPVVGGLVADPSAGAAA